VFEPASTEAGENKNKVTVKSTGNYPGNIGVTVISGTIGICRRSLPKRNCYRHGRKRQPNKNRGGMTQVRLYILKICQEINQGWNSTRKIKKPLFKEGVFYEVNFKKEGKTINILKKLPWKIIITIILAAAFSLGAMNYLSTWVAANQESVSIPVPTHRIYPNQVIKQSDLIEIRVVKSSVAPKTVTDPTQVAGKVAVTDLFPSEQIRGDKLVEPDQALKTGEAIVTVKAENLEQIMGGNIEPNMIVDVLYTGKEEEYPVLLAESAKVLSVLRGDGSTVGEGILPGKDNTPKMVTLKVKKQEIYEFTRPLRGGFVMLVQVAGHSGSPHS